MADQGKHWIPNPPGGLHGPSIEDSGHILDPTVRREIRELLVPALQDAFRDLAGSFAEMVAGGSRPPVKDLLPPMPAALPEVPAPPAPPGPLPNVAMPAAQPSAATSFDPAEHAHGTPELPDPKAANPPQVPRPLGGRPYPHGDLDLSDLPANVEPLALPPRRGAARRFYFLEGRDQPHKGG